MASFQSPLNPIVTTSKGRVAQLELGVGNNQFARASDVNPLFDYLNNRSGDNITSATGSSVTINAPIGKVTTASLSTAAGSEATITITDSAVTANSVILCVLQSYSGILGTNGVPVIRMVTPSAGSFTVSIRNIHASNALSGTVTFKFIVF